MNGFLIIDKPTGVTSFSMVALVRRLTGVRRVGHAGTLDPLASGVLPVAIGQATRLIEYLDDAAKEYRARIGFGIATDTYDAEGRVVEERDASRLQRADVERALAGFVGELDQAPPPYSAIKVAGTPLYRYARSGKAVRVAARRVRIDRIELRSFSLGEAEIDVACGKGTYIRSLAHDLGQVLGCGAHLSALVRLSSGGFSIDEAHAPDGLVAAAGHGELDELLLAPDRAVERRSAAILGAAAGADVLAGRDLSFEGPEAVSVCRAYRDDGAFLGVLHRRLGAVWHPKRVLTPASSRS